MTDTSEECKKAIQRHHDRVLLEQAGIHIAFLYNERSGENQWYAWKHLGRFSRGTPPHKSIDLAIEYAMEKYAADVKKVKESQ